MPQSYQFPTNGLLPERRQSSAASPPLNRSFIEQFLFVQLLPRQFVCNGKLRIARVEALDLYFGIRVKLPSEVPREQHTFLHRDLIALLRRVMVGMKHARLIYIDFVETYPQHFP